MNWSYGWWEKSCTTQHAWNLVNNGIFTVSTGAGFLPSTVCFELLYPYDSDSQTYSVVLRWLPFIPVSRWLMESVTDFCGDGGNHLGLENPKSSKDDLMSSEIGETWLNFRIHQSCTWGTLGSGVAPCMEALSTSTNRCECSHFEVKYRSTTKYVFPAAFGPWCTTSFLFDSSSMFALWIIAGVKTLVWDLLPELPGLLIHTLWQVLALAEAPTAQNLWLTEEVSASFATHSGGSYRNVSIREGWVESWGRMFAWFARGSFEALWRFQSLEICMVWGNLLQNCWGRRL